MLLSRSTMDGDAEFNPYAPPQAATLIHDGSPEAIRQAHITHETSIKSVGALYALIGGLMLLPVFISLLESVTRATSADDFAPLAVALLVGMGVLVLGASVRRLKPWTRISMAVVSGLLAAVTLFTVFFPALNLYIIWLMISAKGRMVFSPAYQHIIALTPDMRPRHSVLAVILVVLVLLLVTSMLAALLVPLFTRR